MSPIARIGLVAVLLLAVAGGGALLVLREADAPASMTLGGPPGEAPGEAAPAADENDHLGRIGLPVGPDAPEDPAEDDLAEGGTLRVDTLLPTDRGGPRTLSWDDLVPAEGQGEPVVFAQGTREREGMPEREAFGEEITEEEIEAFIYDIDSMRSLQPEGAAIRTDLDGVEVRLAGYATPIGFDDQVVTEFLLVPWLGACIHTPPPPANQIVYATEATGLDMAAMWEPIWITGTLRAVPSATVLADVGYRIEGAVVEPYL